MDIDEVFSHSASSRCCGTFGDDSVNRLSVGIAPDAEYIAVNCAEVRRNFKKAGEACR